MPNGFSAAPDILRPRIVRGEMAQGIITSQYIAEQRKTRYDTDTVNEVRLKNILYVMILASS